MMWRHKIGFIFLTAFFFGSCRPLDMYDQEKYEPYEQSDIFADTRSARMLPLESVPQKVGKDDLPNDNEAFKLTKFPLALDIEALKRGQERFNIYCSPCHGLAGMGDGMIVQRGFKKPPSFHIDRLQEVSIGYIYSVMTLGFGVMPSYHLQIQAKDRWLIVAYVKSLQLSQNISIDQIPENERKKLETP